MSDVISGMDALAERGWIVTLQRIPDGIPFLFSDERDSPKCLKRYSAKAAYLKGRETLGDEWKYISADPYCYADTAEDALNLLTRRIGEYEAEWRERL